MMRTKHKRIPEDVYERVGRIGTNFGVPNTKAFVLQEKFLMGDFVVKGMKKKRNGKKQYLLEFDI